MEIVELVPGVQFPSAVELPNKSTQWVNGHHKSSGNNSGGDKHKHRISLPGKMNAELQKIAQQKTKENRKMLVISGGKRRWVRLADWKG